MNVKKNYLLNKKWKHKKLLIFQLMIQSSIFYWGNDKYVVVSMPCVTTLLSKEGIMIQSNK